MAASVNLRPRSFAHSGDRSKFARARYRAFVPVGDCERQFAAAAAADGIALLRARLPWLNQRGHLGLPADLADTRSVLERIFVALGGDLAVQEAKRRTPLPGDFLHRESGTLIEVDDSQHFTTFRLRTLNLYPATVSLGFDPDR